MHQHVMIENGSGASPTRTSRHTADVVRSQLSGARSESERIQSAARQSRWTGCPSDP